MKGSSTVVLLTGPNAAARGTFNFGSTIRSTMNLISAASTGEPSLLVIPCLTLNVHSLPSGDVVQLSKV